jgi:hypothetical protein
VVYYDPQLTIDECCRPLAMLRGMSGSTPVLLCEPKQTFDGESSGCALARQSVPLQAVVLSVFDPKCPNSNSAVS